MHPSIRMLNLLVLAGLAPWLPEVALFGVAALLVIMGVASRDLGMKMIGGLRRIRWLLGSLFVFCFWFTPGEPVFPVVGNLSPTLPGIALGLHRVGVLVVMVWAAVVFIGALQPYEIAAGLRKLLVGPLNSDITRRFADRTAMLFAELPKTESHVRDAVQGDGKLADKAAGLFSAIEARAATPSAHSITPPSHRDVPRMQWLLPLLLCAAGVVLARLGV